jgi:hypothetical protein
LVIGAAGVLSSNPLSFSDQTEARVSDHICIAVFQGLVRLFFAVHLEILRTHSATPSPLLVAILASIFAIYITIEAAASYDRRRLTLRAAWELRTERALVAASAIWSAIAVVHLIVAGIGNEGVNARRVALLAILVLACVGGTLFSEVYCVLRDRYMDTAVPGMLQAAIFASSAAVLLYMLRSAGGHYKEIEGTAATAVRQMELEWQEAKDSDEEDQ